MFPKQFLSKHIYFSRLNDSWKLSTTQHLWDFFATTFLFFVIHSEKRWRRKQHHQINHIKNISSSNYISIRIIQNITHKVDINEMRKNRDKKSNLSFFVYFCWHCVKHGLFSFQFIKLWMQWTEKKINLSIYNCLHITWNKKNNIMMTQVFFQYQISCSK